MNIADIETKQDFEKTLLTIARGDGVKEVGQWEGKKGGIEKRTVETGERGMAGRSIIEVAC